MRSKKEIRAQIRFEIKKRALTKPLVYETLLDNLCNFSVLEAVDLLVAFSAIGHEPDLTPFLKSWLFDKRKLLMPRFDNESSAYELAEISDFEQDMVLGFYDIKEPSITLKKVIPPVNSSKVWLIPGLAFSESGARLGRGAGYYDRLLQGTSGPKVGICLEYQLVDEIPVLEYDVNMDYIVTETRIIKCRNL
jgi:5-formyltetrahydrofolate cyclo-ligase